MSCLCPVLAVPYLVFIFIFVFDVFVFVVPCFRLGLVMLCLSIFVFLFILFSKNMTEATTALGNKQWLLSKLMKRLDYDMIMPPPKLVSGAGSIAKMGEVAKKLKVSKFLVVTDEMLVKVGIVQPLLDALDAAGVGHAVFDGVLPNPTVDHCQAGWEMYKTEKCDGIVAIGGGSSMDCAKIIGAKASNPERPWKGFVGVQDYKALPPFVAVPTTAGTGSETTVGAVITFPEEQTKYTMMSMKLMPKMAIMDPELILKLPKGVTAATGMDALTHAVEAYIGNWQSEASAEFSRRAVATIFKHLLTTYHEPSNIEAREAMLVASFDAGVAITRANVGYVHAVAHQLGGLYHMPHGEANSMILPYMLEFFVDHDQTAQRLAELAKVAGLDEGGELEKWPRTLALKFIAAIKSMNAEMGLPAYCKGLKAEDIELVATRAMNEAHGVHNFWNGPLKFFAEFNYPVPKFMTMKDCRYIVSRCVERPQAKL